MELLPSLMLSNILAEEKFWSFKFNCPEPDVRRDFTENVATQLDVDMKTVVTGKVHK